MMDIDLDTRWPNIDIKLNKVFNNYIKIPPKFLL